MVAGMGCRLSSPAAPEPEALAWVPEARSDGIAEMGRELSNREADSKGKFKRLRHPLCG